MLEIGLKIAWINSLDCWLQQTYKESSFIILEANSSPPPVGVETPNCILMYKVQDDNRAEGKERCFLDIENTGGKCPTLKENDPGL